MDITLAYEAKIESSNLSSHAIMNTKRCTACGEEKPLGEFNLRYPDNGIYQSQCRECANEYKRQHYLRNKQYRQAAKNRARQQREERRPKIVEFMIEYLKAHPCVDCGETELVVLEFDHREGEKKKHNIASIVNGSYSLDVVKGEIAKCDVRCANCHRRKTAERKGGNYKTGDLARLV